MKKLITSIRTKPINLILILVVLILYFLNNRLLKTVTTGPVQIFFSWYFNDMICPLLFLGYANILLRTVDKELRKLPWILLVCFCASLVWEFFAPVIKPKAVADLRDILFYMFGGFLYWSILRLCSRKNRKEHSDDPAS